MSLDDVPGVSRTRHIVIDTDMAPDDWIAILYLLGRADVSVDAITVTGTGESHCEPGIEHARGLVTLAGHRDIPVACGRETPLACDHEFPEEWRARVDALLGLSLPVGTGSATDETAAGLLTRVIQGSAEPLTILALGPLTNIAETIEAEPSLAHKIRAIYVMGGAVRAEGNIDNATGIENRFAEWNIYGDPHAAKMVLESGVPVTLVPLDATNDVPISEAFADELRSSAATDSANFVSQVLDARMSSIRDGSIFFWDPFAAAIILDESLTSFETAPLTVETREGPDSGRIVRADTGPEIRYAVSGNRAKFEKHLLATLNGQLA